VVAAFLHAPALAKWLDKAGTGLEKFAGYVGTDKFAETRLKVSSSTSARPPIGLPITFHGS
jgi:hypothetical protein